MTKQKVRAAWMGDNLFAEFPGTNKTKARVLKDAGFNLVHISMSPDRKNRDVSTRLEEELPGNVREARRVRIPLLVGCITVRCTRSPTASIGRPAAT